MDNTITIENIQQYSQQILNGNLILTRLIPVVDVATLFQKNLRGSTILECKINNMIRDIKKYKKLLINLYSETDIETIIENTTLNIKREERYDKGFQYYSNLRISIQGSDTRKTLHEIINIIQINNYSMELKIKLINDEVIRFII